MADLIKVSILGAMPSGEKWSVSPVFKVDGAGGGTPVSELDAAATAINAITIATGVRLMMNSATTITGVRVEARNTGGTLEGLSEKNRATPVAGTGTSPHPFQTSIVSSLRTNAPGARGRGRLYWPGTGASLDSLTLRLASGSNSTFAAGIKTYLTDIRTAADTAIGGTLTLAVWSRVSAAADALQPVVRIQVGDVLDTQRRRRDTLIESTAEVAFP